MIGRINDNYSFKIRLNIFQKELVLLGVKSIIVLDYVKNGCWRAFYGDILLIGSKFIIFPRRSVNNLAVI